MRAATVDVSLVGEGSLSGRASQPVAKAEMEVDSGTIRLPGGLLRVESGGTVTLNYRSIPGDTVANLKLDMIGNTSLTTVAYGDTVGRYDISVVVTGDLLQSSGLTLVASSDPPGLTQDRILALLGSTDVLEAIGGTSTRNTAQERIRNAVAGYAIPTLFEPITSGFAKGLGFQYLNLDYNTTDLASLSFAKAFSSELFVQGRRQLAQTRPNLPIQYDLRLVYRPRRVKGFLQRLSLSLGTDQDRPWKISVDYGTRF